MKRKSKTKFKEYGLFKKKKKATRRFILGPKNEHFVKTYLRTQF